MLVDWVGVVGGVRGVEHTLSVLRHESSQGLIDEDGIGGVRSDVPGLAQKLLVYRRTYPYACHATIIPSLCYRTVGALRVTRCFDKRIVET